MRELLRNRDFVKLWAGETISLVGSHVTELALPLTAVLTLDADGGELGILGGARFAPFLVVTLFAGVWADRSRRRPIMVGANVGRAAALALVPVLAAADLLRIEHLYAIGFFIGVLTVLFDVSYVTVVPSLVGRRDLVRANSAMQASASVAEVGGPGLGGALVSVLGAPMALAIDAGSYVISAASLGAIRTQEARPEVDGEPSGIFTRIGEGLRVTFGNALLRAIAISAALYNFFEQSIFTLLALYATRELGLSPAALGLVLSSGALGALVGSVVATRLADSWGIGRAYVAATALGAALLLLPAAPLTRFPAAVLVAAFAVNGIGLGVTNVHAVTLRQTLTPSGLLGRMNASYRFLTYGAIPLGALLGGGLSEVVGVRAAVAIAAVGLLSGAVVLVLSPMRKLRGMPEDLDHETASA